MTPKSSNIIRPIYYLLVTCSSQGKSSSFPTSDSLGLLTLKVDGRRWVPGGRPRRGASRCPGGTSVVSLWCFVGVSVAYWWCLNVSVVSVVSLWGLGGVSVVSRWCLSGLVLVSAGL